MRSVRRGPCSRRSRAGFPPPASCSCAVSSASISASTARSTHGTTTTSSCLTTASGATTEPTARVSATAADRSCRSSCGGVSGCAATTTHAVGGTSPAARAAVSFGPGAGGRPGEQVLEQVAPHALALRVQEALGLEVDLAGLGGRRVDVADDRPRGLHRALARGLVVGAGDQCVPELLLVDAKRLEERGQRDAGRRDGSRGRA